MCEDCDDLADRVADLEDRLDAMKRWNETLSEENEHLRDEIDGLRADLERHETQLDALGDIGAEKTSKEQKIAAIVAYAANARQPEQPAVTVLPKTITGVADVSRRYAYDLVDAMIDGDGEDGAVGPDGYDWAHDPADVPRHLEQDAPQKGVLIDFEGVHGEAVAVNKFITRSRAQGVAD